MYPMLKEGVSLGTFTYEGSDDLYYYVSDPDGEEYEIEDVVYKALAKADGTKPLNLPNEIISQLKEYDLIQTSRFMKGQEGFDYFILFPVGSRAKKYRNLCVLLNNVLPVASILIFTVSLFLKSEAASYISHDFNDWVYYSLFVISLFLHEMGHLTAGLAYGYEISDMGVLLFLGVLPIGAYVAGESKRNVSKLNRIQLALAGVEVNFLLAGVCILLSMKYYALSQTLIAVANMNITLVILNLLPAFKLDGETAISEALGVKSISSLSKKILLRKKNRKRLLRSGIRGYVCFGVFGFSLLSEVVVWLLIGLEVVCIVFNIFC